VVGLRLPEDEEDVVALTRRQKARRKLAEIWASVAGV
jgi:potassium/hydrogen antiporter